MTARRCLAYRELSLGLGIWILNPCAACGYFGQYRIMWKKQKNDWKLWEIGTHLRVLSESYPMNTKMTGFRGFQKSLHPYALDKSSLSIERVKMCLVMLVAKNHQAVDQKREIKLHYVMWWLFIRILSYIQLSCCCWFYYYVIILQWIFVLYRWACISC